MTIRLEAEIKKKPARLSAATRRSNSFLAAEAIREYLATNEWQIRQIRAAIAEADAGDFASAAEVKAVLGKWDADND